MSKLPFFKNGPSAFHNAIALKLRPQVCLAGDFVIRVGDLAREMYIAHRGRLRVIAPHQEQIVKDQPMETETVRARGTSSFAEEVCVRARAVATVARISITDGYLSFGPMAQCVVHALKGLA